MARGDTLEQQDTGILGFAKNFKFSYLVYAIIVAVFANLIVSPLLNDEVKCESPYEKISGICCLDNNNNNICDIDEIIEEKLELNRTILPWVTKLTVPKDTNIREDTDKKLAFRIGNDGSVVEDFFIIEIIEEPENPLLSLKVSGGGTEKIARGETHFVIGNLVADKNVKPGKVRYLIIVKDTQNNIYVKDSFRVTVINPNYEE